MKSLNLLKEVFNVFQDKESFFTEIDEKKSKQLIIKQLLIVCLFGLIYGIVMGSYQGLVQAGVAGLKLMILFILSLLICFPSFYIIQLVLGSKMSFRQMIIIILSGFVLASTITLSFAPIIIFFLLTGSNYHFLQLLHVAIFIFSGVFGMKLMIDALKYACEKKNIYPQIGVTVLKVWIVILAFVGIQLSWNLRPFLGDKNEEFKLFRKYEGNFYTAVVYSVEQLFTKNLESGKEIEEFHYDKNIEEPDSTSLIQKLEE
jgi:hypothetical protein